MVETHKTPISSSKANPRFKGFISRTRGLDKIMSVTALFKLCDHHSREPFSLKLTSHPNSCIFCLDFDFPFHPLLQMPWLRLLPCCSSVILFITLWFHLLHEISPDPCEAHDFPHSAQNLICLLRKASLFEIYPPKLSTSFHYCIFFRSVLTI